MPPFRRHLGGLQSALPGLAAAGGSGDHGDLAAAGAEGAGKDRVVKVSKMSKPRVILGGIPKIW